MKLFIMVAMAMIGCYSLRVREHMAVKSHVVENNLKREHCNDPKEKDKIYLGLREGSGHES